MTLRRDFLAMTAGAVAAKTMLPLAARAQGSQIEIFTPHPDATLLALCQAFHQACTDLAAVNAKDDPTDEEIGPIVDAWGAPIDTITSTPATTLEGVRAKAQAVIDAFSSGGVDRHRGETVEETAGHHELMAWRLMHEILAMGAQA